MLYFTSGCVVKALINGIITQDMTGVSFGCSIVIHRHDISDKLWEKMERKTPGSKDYTGRPAYDKRKFINAVFGILRTGASLRNLQKEYGDCGNTRRRRFCRLRDMGM